MNKKLEALLLEYLVSNPGAENPIQFFYSLGLNTIEEILVIAENRLIEFNSIEDEKGNILTDLLVPFIDGKPIKGFEPNFEGWKIAEIEQSEEDEVF